MRRCVYDGAGDRTHFSRVSHVKVSIISPFLPLPRLNRLIATRVGPQKHCRQGCDQEGAVKSGVY